MKSNEHILRTRDGRLIAFNLKISDSGGTGRVLVIAPEVGLDQQFYQPLTNWCTTRGINVITFDYRSQGQSAPLNHQQLQDTLRQWANQDLDVVLGHARRRFPEGELILLAHGISGEIAGMAASIENIDYLVLVSSALHVRQFWPWKTRVFAAMGGLFTPVERIWARRFLPGEKKMPSHVAQELYEWSGYHDGLFNIFPDNNYRRLNVPLLTLNFTDDPYSPQKAVDKLLRHYCPSGIKRMRIRPADMAQKNIGHNGFFEPRNEKLWTLMLDWLRDTTVEKRYFF